jgi:hypothetical protein
MRPIQLFNSHDYYSVSFMTSNSKSTMEWLSLKLCLFLQCIDMKYVFAYYLHEYISFIFVTIFRVCLDKNTVNMLTTYIQDVYERAPDLQPN